jgi:hypothetical protein
MPCEGYERIYGPIAVPGGPALHQLPLTITHDTLMNYSQKAVIKLGQS